MTLASYRLAATAALAALVVTTAGAAGAASPTAAPAAATASVLLSVGPAFDADALPEGSFVLATYPRLGSLLVRLPAAEVAALRTVPGVRGVRPDYELNVTNEGTSSTSGVLAPAAVGGISGTGGAGAKVTVALLDTGVADTAGLARAGGRLVSGVDTSGESSATRDGHGHGTFMANLIAGGSVNGKQVGMAPAAKVVDVKVASADGSTSLSKVLGGLDWIVNNRDAHGIRVLNLSLAAEQPLEGYGQDPLTDGAESLRAAGIVVVVATGNTAGTLGTPGHDPLLMAVGAADTRSASTVTADFSGSGVVSGMPRPDVVAPGVSLLSLLPADSAIAKANPHAASVDGLYRGTGTSGATAVTSGAVAVFLSGKSGLTPDDVRASFAMAARDLAGSADGAGLISLPKKIVRWSAESVADDSTASGNWSSSTWTSSSWSSRSWSSRSWSSRSWSSSSWSANSWSSRSWSSRSWSAQW